MTAPWTQTGDKWPQMAMVMVHEVDMTSPQRLAAIGTPYSKVTVGDRWIHSCALHPMPPTITPEQQAVLDAAVRQELIGGSTSGFVTAINYGSVCRKTNEAVRAMLAAQQPVDPVKELREAWEGMQQNGYGAGWSLRMEAAIAALEVKS